MDSDEDGSVGWVDIEDVGRCAAAVDARLEEELGRVMRQRRSVRTAMDYVRALAPGVKANCWSLAEAAGHGSWHRMHALLGPYRWEWTALRDRLSALAAQWLPCDPDDLIGPGVAIDETAQLKKGDATAGVAPQHAGITGKVENCVTTVFCAYVSTTGQAWVDFDIYLPKRWAGDPDRRAAAGIGEDLTMRTKPQLAIDQLQRLLAGGLPIRWAAFDEVYGRSSALRQVCEEHALPYVAIIPRDFMITTGVGEQVQAQHLADGAVFERRSAGTGSKGPRYSDWALVGTADPGRHLLIRRLISRPDQYTFYLCYAPPERPTAITYFVTISGRRWPVEETFKTGKDVLGWDQSQARTWTAQCRHTTLAALAQLRQAAIRNSIHGDITPPEPPQQSDTADTADTADTVSSTSRSTTGPESPIPTIACSDAPIPTRPDQPRPPDLGPIRLTIAETARLTRLATDWAAGLLARTQLAFALHWSTRRRHHQATARWHHHAARLARP